MAGDGRPDGTGDVAFGACPAWLLDEEDLVAPLCGPCGGGECGVVGLGDQHIAVGCEVELGWWAAGPGVDYDDAGRSSEPICEFSHAMWSVSSMVGVGPTGLNQAGGVVDAVGEFEEAVGFCV